jgi:GT2 family glycosyltransferase
MRTCTVVIPTYERRGALERALVALRRQVDADPSLAVGLDIVVVVDGSTDGSLELVEQLDFPSPVKAIWQRNRGRSAARNAGLAVASGEIVLFLDDDLVPEPGLLRRHRRAHEVGNDHIHVGPYPLAPESPIAPNKRWFDDTYAELARTGVINRADRFSIANTSGPAEIFRAVGGFDESFTGWGVEDLELGYRLLCAGYEIRFDPDALATHQQDLSATELCANCVSNGRNLVRAFTLHPGLVDHLMPSEHPESSPERARRTAATAFRRVTVRSPLPYRLLASAACGAARVESTITGNQSQRALYFAMVMSTLAGIAEADPSGAYVARKLGIGAPSDD